MVIFTIGHSNLSIEIFISWLHQHKITAIADVRSHPYSRYLPHFSQKNLKASLLNVWIKYVFLGKELGARTEDLSCYDLNGKALYERIAATELFSKGIQRLIKGAENHTICLMCAEKDPITCHRTILVCRHLRKLDIQINHILDDGNLESHQQAEERLLAKFNKSQPQNIQLSLFQSSLPENIIDLESTYHLQGQEIAYIKKDSNESTD